MKAKNFSYEGEALTFDVVDEKDNVIMRHGIGNPAGRLPENPTSLDLERIIEIELRRTKDSIALQKQRDAKITQIKAMKLPEEIGISQTPVPPSNVKVSESGPPYLISGRVGEWAVEIEIRGPEDYFDTTYPDNKRNFSLSVPAAGNYEIVARNRVGEISESVEIEVALPKPKEPAANA
jgi:hypothetical protein